MADSVEKSKKRKRNADGSSKASKKVAIMEDRRIKISVQTGDEWVPIIGMQAHSSHDIPRSFI
jgi:DNA-directed RNA polymerase I subunit RPA49